MSEIAIYKSEIADGIGDLIKSQASIAYASPLFEPDSFKPSVLNSCKLKMSDMLAQGGVKDLDIYHTFSILVTSSWNRNDDVFAKGEIWEAKNTPKFKPANLEHDEKKIVGGIIGSWAVDDEFQLIDETTEANELPDNYHILVSSVIYRQWQDPEYKARAEDLIRKIEEGNMFVSMECIFRGFDYAVRTPNEENKIIARSEDTSFLSRHLRAYGGTGEYQGHKVGRLLRNITFSGKGFVEKPANPDSIIFDRGHIFDFAGASVSKNLFSKQNGVSSKVEKEILSKVEPQEEKNLMSNDFLSDQVKELKEALSSVQEENKELLSKLSNANVEKMEGELAELNQTVEALSESLASAQADLEEANAAKEDLLSKVAEEAEARKIAEDAIASLEEEKKRQSRASSLIEAGISEDEVDSKLETFASLSDEQFQDIVSTIAALKTVSEAEDASDSFTTEAEETETEETLESGMQYHGDKDKKKKKKEVEESEASEEVDEEVLETASIEEEADLAVPSDEIEDEAETVRAGLQSWVNSYVLNSED